MMMMQTSAAAGDSPGGRTSVALCAPIDSCLVICPLACDTCSAAAAACVLSSVGRCPPAGCMLAMILQEIDSQQASVLLSRRCFLLRKHPLVRGPSHLTADFAGDLIATAAAIIIIIIIIVVAL